MFSRLMTLMHSGLIRVSLVATQGAFHDSFSVETLCRQ